MEAADAGQAVIATADRSDEDSSPRPYVFVDEWCATLRPPAQRSLTLSAEIRAKPKLVSA
jgi:hypothetical protein